MNKGIIVVQLCLLLGGCAPSSLEDFQHEGESQCKAIVRTLQNVENYEQLLSLESVLKKKFEFLVELLIQAREFQERHPEDIALERDLSVQKASAALQTELMRIYGIEGGRDLIERCQQEALVKLDAFERSRKKDKLLPYQKLNPAK